MNSTGTGFCVSAYRSIQLFRRESALISVRVPFSSIPCCVTWRISRETTCSGYFGWCSDPRVQLFFFMFSDFFFFARPPMPTMCFLSMADCVHDIQHDFGAVQRHHLSDQWCHVLRVVDVRVRERRGRQQHCVSIGLVHDVWLLCGKAILFEYCFCTVSILWQCCFHTVSILFPYCFHTVSILFPYCFNTVSMLRQYFFMF